MAYYSRLYLRESLREAHSRPMHVYLLRKFFSSFKRFSSSSNDPGPLLSASRASATMASRSDSHVCWIPSAPSVEDAPRSLCKVARAVSKPSVVLFSSSFKISFSSSSMVCESSQYISTISSIKVGSESVCKSSNSSNCARLSKLFTGSNACFSIASNSPSNDSSLVVFMRASSSSTVSSLDVCSSASLSSPPSCFASSSPSPPFALGSASALPSTSPSRAIIFVFASSLASPALALRRVDARVIVPRNRLESYPRYGYDRSIARARTRSSSRARPRRPRAREKTIAFATRATGPVRCLDVTASRHRVCQSAGDTPTGRDRLGASKSGVGRAGQRIRYV